MKFAVKEKDYPVKSILLTPHDLANMLPDIFFRIIHTGYTPRGSMMTASLSVLKYEILLQHGIVADGECDFDEEIVEACKLVVKQRPLQFEFALYRQPKNNAPAELGLRYYINPKI